MIVLLFAAGLILLILCVKTRGRLRTEAKTTRFTYYLVEHSLAFLIPFTTVAGIYVALDGAVAFVDQDASTIAALREWESWLHWFLGLVGALKLSAWQTFGVLILLFGIAVVATILRVRGDGRAESVQAGARAGATLFKRYSKPVWVAYVILIFVCSFSFFGSRMTDQLERLRLHLVDAEDVAQLGTGLSEALRDEVEDAVFKQVRDTTPGYIAASLQRIDHVWELERKLSERYRDAVVRYGVRDAGVQQFVERLAARQQTLERAFEAPQDRPRTSGFEVGPVPLEAQEGELTPGKLRLIRESLKAWNAELVKTAQAILELDETKRLTVHALVALPVDTVKEVFKDVPWAEFVLDVFQRTLGDLATQHVEARIFKPAAERLARAAAAGGDSDGLRTVLANEGAQAARAADAREHWQQYEQEKAEQIGRSLLELDRREEDVQAISLELEATEQKAKEQKTKEALKAEKRAILARTRNRAESLAERFFNESRYDPPLSPNGSPVVEEKLTVAEAMRRDLMASRVGTPQEAVKSYFHEAWEKYEEQETTLATVARLRELEAELNDEARSAKEILTTVEARIGKDVGLPAIQAPSPSGSTGRHDQFRVRNGANGFSTGKPRPPGERDLGKPHTGLRR